jgi:hypothetical protein
MRRVIRYLLLGISATSYGQQSDDSQLIKNTFSNYKKSVLEGNGTEAAKWVDSKTLTYYSKMLQAAVYADSAEVQNLELLDKLIVLSARHRVPKSEILNMQHNDFFVYSIDKGMISKGTVLTVEIGEVNVDGVAANGKLISDGQVSPLFFQFAKEEGQWKLNITSLFPVSNAGLKKRISDNEMTEDEFIFKTLERLTGRPVGKEIWKALK